MSKHIKHFLVTLGPAVIGSAGTQIALFADTIIGSLLPTAAYPRSIMPTASINCRSRHRIAAEPCCCGDEQAFSRPIIQARLACANRTMALSLALTAPFFIAFIMIPDDIMRGFSSAVPSRRRPQRFRRGAHGLWLGLVAIVLVRSAVASFQAKGDTKTPMFVALIAVAINVALKILLFKPFGAAVLLPRRRPEHGSTLLSCVS